MTDHTASSGHDAGAGLGHEVKLLVDMVVEHSAPWLERVRGPEPHAAAGEHGQGQPCVGWCPICTAVNMAKGQSPEFTARAFEQAAQLVALLRAVLADRWHPEQGVHMPGFRPEQAEPSGVRADAVRADAPNATFGAPNAPNATFGAPAPSRNGRRSGSSRVQHVAVRKAEPGEQRP